MPKPNTMNQTTVLNNLGQDYPQIKLSAGDNYYWSPVDKTVYYKEDNSTDEGAWALLHESGHALLQHLHYYTDLELVIMEVEAWEKAKEIAKEQNLEIDEDHIQDCLDSYRDWLHKRSLCPDCNLSGVQTDTHTYCCIFCQKKWKVSAERFCRPYRRTAT